MLAARCLAIPLVLIGFFAAADAHAQEAAPEPPLATRPPVQGPTNIEPPDDPARAQTLVPQPAVQKTLALPPFAVDPVSDGALIVGSGVFAYLLDQVAGTGEIRPQQISPNFHSSQLLWFDRVALHQSHSSSASGLSSVALGVAVGYSVFDTVFTGVEQKSVQTGLTDGLIYLETFSMTWGLTNLAKIAVRRPRPIAYVDAAAHKNDPTYSNSDTDSALSFFSGHTAFVSASVATATYLSFVRHPHTLRPWLTLALGTALTGFVSYERVRAQAHFPSDVIAAAVVGAGIGVLVPHLHRTTSAEQRRVWIGAAPAPSTADGRGANGGSMTLSGVF